MLKQEVEEFLEDKSVHQKVVETKIIKDLLLPNHEFNRDKRVTSKFTNIKWNYKEFEVHY